MKISKVIKGTLFDTTKAKLIGVFDEDYCGMGSLHEELYQKTNGDFFLAHDSSTSEIDGDVINCYGNKTDCKFGIIPLSVSQAMRWAEEHLWGDVYQNLFGKIPEDDTETNIHITICTKTRDAVEAYAVANNITKDEAYNRLLDKAINP